MNRFLERRLADEEATARLGADIALVVKPGDTILLKGELGAGKTALARGLIRQLAGDPELEVPSPTYTLCQSYSVGVALQHFDLYRLADAGELDELGLAEAVETGVTLVEWPERAGEHLPADAVTIELAIGAEGGREARFFGPDGSEATLPGRIARSLAIRDFLDAGWGPDCRRRFLQGDASARRYETVTLGGVTRILMDSPRRPDGPPIRDGRPYSQIVHLAEDVVAFIGIDEILRREGFAAPEIFARSIRDGLLLIEHLGSGSILDSGGRPVAHRYREAARLLAHLHFRTWPARIEGEGGPGERYAHEIPRYDEEAIRTEASLLIDWYAPAFGASAIDDGLRQRFEAIWTGLAGELASEPTLVLRDYHSPNLIWRESEAFPRNLGLIDFQDGLFGPAAYDVVSLAQDARVDISAELEKSVTAAYLEEREKLTPGFDRKAFEREYAILGAQRASKILGIFVRLDRRDGKPAYLRHLPRMRGYLGRNLSHPALAGYRRWCREIGGLVDDGQDDESLS